MRKKWPIVILAFVPFGLLAYVVGLWFYQYTTDPENAPSITDLPGIGFSYLRRGWLIVKGSQTLGASNALDIATAFIAKHEGFSPKAYPDPAGQTKTWSIGYGHQIVPGDGFDTSSTISEADAYALLQADLDTYVACVNNGIAVDLSPEQTAALYSFCYNEGCGAFSKSTLLKDVNAQNFADVPAQLARWNIVGGVVSDALAARRQDEADLFDSGTSQEAAS